MWSPTQIESKPEASAARAIASSSGQRTSRSTSGSWTPTLTVADLAPSSGRSLDVAQKREGRPVGVPLETCGESLLWLENDLRREGELDHVVRVDARDPELA